MPLLGTTGAASAKGFGFTASSGGAVNWVKNFTNTLTRVSGIALNSAKDVFTTGRTTLESSRNITLTGFSKGGATLWQRSLYSTDSADYPTPTYGAKSVAVDSAGNVYFVGSQQNSSNYDKIVIAKYNSSGVIQWQKKINPGGGSAALGSQGVSITADSSDNIYITGRSYSSSTFRAELFISKLNSSGVIQFSTFLTENVRLIGNSIVLDSSNNIYVCGEINPFNNANIIVVKYNSSGAVQWQRELAGTYGNDRAYSIALDSGNNIYVAATVESDTRATLFKLNNSGTLQWQRNLVGTNGISDGALAIDSSDNIYFTCSNYLNGPRFVTEIAKYNSSGTIQYKRRLQATTNDPGWRVFGGNITVDNLGNMCIFPVTFNNYLEAAMVLKVPTDGSKTGIYTVGGFEFEYVVSSITESAGVLTSAAGNLTAGTSTFPIANSSFIDTAGSSTFGFTEI
jgi:hypothetical protein